MNELTNQKKDGNNLLLIGIALISFVVAIIIEGNKPGFSLTGYEIGVIIGLVLGQMLIPLLILIIPAGIYWAFKRKMLPRFYWIYCGIWAFTTFLYLLNLI